MSDDMGVRAGHSAKPEPASRLGQKASVPDADDFDYYDDECWQCGGEGFVYGCSWDWQCDTWDGDSCLCARRCDICNPPEPGVIVEQQRLRQLLANALAQAGEAGTCERCHGEGILHRQDCGAHGHTVPCPQCSAQGMEAFGQDPKGLDAKHDSPVRKDAPGDNS